jgi:lipopolysaccharide transport system permease protein
MLKQLLQHRYLALNLTRREIQNRYAGTGAGFLLALVQPLLQLAVFALVFGVVFAPATPPDSKQPAFVLFLAVGLWPWLMFREGLGRATQSMVNQAALISKVAFPRELLVIASVSASFYLHLLGFIGILSLLAVFGHAVHWQGLLLAAFYLAMLWLITLSLGLFSSALFVFWREWDVLLDALLLAVFYMTPILYRLSTVPEPWRGYLQLNPLAGLFDRLRGALLKGEAQWQWGDLGTMLFALLLFTVCIAWFRRLARSFDDAL